MLIGSSACTSEALAAESLKLPPVPEPEVSHMREGTPHEIIDGTLLMIEESTRRLRASHQLRSKSAAMATKSRETITTARALLSGLEQGERHNSISSIHG